LRLRGQFEQKNKALTETCSHLRDPGAVQK